jgi:hypothetical protein
LHRQLAATITTTTVVRSVSWRECRTRPPSRLRSLPPRRSNLVALPVIRGFGGMVPKLDSQVLPDNMAELAYNCDLSAGTLNGLPMPALAHDFSAIASAVRKAYRFPDPDGVGADVWLNLPSEHSSVVRSPLANDTNRRIYWTNPGDTTPHWSTYAMLVAGSTAWDLGMPQPVATSGGALTTGVAGGSAPTVYRSYCFTYVNQYGEESAPNFPSAVVGGPSDGTWSVTGLPTTAPVNPSGRNYPPVVQLNLYRTVSGAQTGGQFFLVAQFNFSTSPPTSPYTDTVSDVSITGGSGFPPLETTSWGNPPDGLDGLTALPGGMLVGFVGNTVHFCEPNRPHTWPASYDQSLGYVIVGLAVWQQALVALTEGFPSTGSGNAPSNFIFTTVRAAEPCIARGSIVTDLSGVYYASQNGLIQLSGYGAQNQSLPLFTKNIWLTDYAAASIVACRHRTQYLAINGSGVGFFLDYAEPRNGVMKLNTFDDAVSVWNDEYSGDAYILSNKKVYLWDSPAAETMNYRGLSRMYFLPAPTSLGACFIVAGPEILTATDPGTPLLDNGDSSLDLPAGVNAIFKLYRGQERTLVATRNLRKTKEIFRLPAGAKSHHWQCEIVSRIPITSIELASTMRELKGV